MIPGMARLFALLPRLGTSRLLSRGSLHCLVIFAYPLIAYTYACHSSGEPQGGFGCTGDEAPAVLIRVRDATTMAPAAYGVRGVVRDGSYSDSLRVTRWVGTIDSAGALGLSAANERSGRYAVSMERNGYVPWDTVGIIVDRGLCHVHTVEFNVVLHPEP